MLKIEKKALEIIRDREQAEIEKQRAIIAKKQEILNRAEEKVKSRYPDLYEALVEANIRFCELVEYSSTDDATVVLEKRDSPGVMPIRFALVINLYPNGGFPFPEYTDHPSDGDRYDFTQAPQSLWVALWKKFYPAK
jgi:hypothetical protein